MTISSINLAMAGSYGAYSQKLTTATRNKLNELGVPFNDNITEQEGKKLVKQAEVQKQQDSHNQNNFSNKQNSSDYLLEKAKELAKKLGIQLGEDEEFKAILVKIEQAIETQILANQGNEDKLKKLKNLSLELADIQAQSTGSSGYDNTNKVLMMSLEMLSEYNKAYLK